VSICDGGVPCSCDAFEGAVKEQCAAVVAQCSELVADPCVDFTSDDITRRRRLQTEADGSVPAVDDVANDASAVPSDGDLGDAYNPTRPPGTDDPIKQMLVDTLTTCTKSEVESKANAVRHTIELAVTSIDEVDTEALAQQFADAAGVDVSDIEVVAETVNVVKQEVTIKGDINSFNITAFTEAIAAAAGVPVEDVTVELKPVETRRRRLDGARRLSEGAAAGGEFKAEATIETKDETVAQAAKEKLAEKVSDKEAASELLGVEVAEDPPPPVDEQKVEVTTTILAEDALAEADVVSNLEDKLGTAEEASDVLGLPVAEVAAVEVVTAAEISPPPPPSAPPPPSSPPPVSIIDRICPEGTEGETCSLAVWVIGAAAGGSVGSCLLCCIFILGIWCGCRHAAHNRRHSKVAPAAGIPVGGPSAAFAEDSMAPQKRLYEGQMMERG
jgi:hypothetical protein